MTRLVLAFLVLTAAALLAAVGWVLLRPRWRWDPPTVDEWEPPERAQFIPVDEWLEKVRAYSTGSPESVTSRADNGTGLFV